MLPADRNCFNYQLTEFQHKLLWRLANGKVKIYCMPAGVPADKKEDELNDQFNQVLQLVELGVMNDVSAGEKFKPLVDEHRMSENRDVVIVWINGFGQELFGRCPWDKYVN